MTRTLFVPVQVSEARTHDGRCSRPGPGRKRWGELPLQLRQAPDLGPIDPDVRFDVGGRLPDGG
jgi:hypothetical protein